MNLTQSLLTPIVSATEMQAIESRMFKGGMPIAALMEKVGLRLTEKIATLFSKEKGYDNVSILVGPGHNGGDALVVGRELWEKGYHVKLFRPFPQAKPLTAHHWDYAQHLGIAAPNFADWLQSDVIIDGLFGFGLARPIEADLAVLIDQINQSSLPVVSLDLPSGIHTNTGAVLGTAIVARYTLCLGLWKQAFFQEQALNNIGQAHLIPIGISEADQVAVLGKHPRIQSISAQQVQDTLDNQRPTSIHKYEMGATLLICGSSQYPGAAILAARAAQTTGVGMLYVAIPQSLRHLLITQVPDAIAIACPETPSGAIAKLPDEINLNKMTSVAIGPGLTLEASRVLHQSLSLELPLILDADALNILETLEWRSMIHQRTAPTILTPHWGEFKRLFPEEVASKTAQNGDRITLLANLSQQIQATLVLKGARTLIAEHQQPLLINPESTPALARGGSGDVLTGIIAGLVAQNPGHSMAAIASTAVWWHAQAALFSERTLTQSGVHPQALIEALNPFRRSCTHVFDRLR